MSAIVREGSVRLRVVRNPKRIGNQRFVDWEFRWRDGAGRPRRLKRALKQDALKEARRIARELAAGRSAELSSADVASFRAGVTNLFACGVTIEAASAEYAEARRRLAGSGSVLEAADFFARHYAAGESDKPIAEIVTELLADRRVNKRSAVHLKDLNGRLGKFAEAVKCPIRQLNAPVINNWLTGLGLSPRSVQNYRGAISNLIEFAIGRKYLPPDFAEMRFVTTPTRRETEVEIFTIAEMRSLLQNASKSLLPVLVLGGFAGLRTSETLQISWEHIHWNKGVITVPRGKTGKRLAPLMDNASEWLRLLRPPGSNGHGRIVSISGSTISKSMMRAAASATKNSCGEIAWKHNALRHSFVTYWTSFEHNLWKVSERTGHNIRILKKNYQRQEMMEDMGRGWFEIRPDTHQLYLFDDDSGQKICPLVAPSTISHAKNAHKTA